tara:strand:+ start:9516 stop:9971 length:456 start_codon:yes stop_codon:yes gene_type:complete
MAIIDERLEFCDATALSTSGTGLALVGDVVDITSASSDLGMGEALYLVIQVTTAVTSGGSATVNFKLASDAAAGIAVDGSATVHNVTADIPKATLTAGHRIVMPLSSGTTKYERFIGIIQDVGSAALTAGAIDAFISKDPIGWTAYPDATN